MTAELEPYPAWEICVRRRLAHVLSKHAIVDAVRLTVLDMVDELAAVIVERSPALDIEDDTLP